jgi:hypothetical protein
VLALIGAGCHRLSEIAGRLGKLVTSLARPLATLMKLGLVRRDLPFGASLRTASARRIVWRTRSCASLVSLRRAEPLEARGEPSREPSRRSSPMRCRSVSGVEDLARESVLCVPFFGRRWEFAASWWGLGFDRAFFEIDVVG